jgi:hypothetical protein
MTDILDEQYPPIPNGEIKPVRVFSFGGGVQSTAVLVLQAMGQLCQPYDYFIFANVGEDSENPATLEYIQKYTLPFAKRHNIPLIEVRKTIHKKPETLWQYIHRMERSVPIPARMSNGAPGNRSCTNDFKIKVVDKWVKQQGYTHATIGLGISLDEFTRMRDENWHDTDSHAKLSENETTNNIQQLSLFLQGENEETAKVSKPRKLGFWKRREHPLIALRMNRLQCQELILKAGLPLPTKSSCFFCPFSL